MYKCINKLAPDYLADKVVQHSHIHIETPDPVIS